MKLADKLKNSLNDQIDEAKSVNLPNSEIVFLGISKDSNGNTIGKFKNSKGKGFSIQTNGNLPELHKLRGNKLKDFGVSALDNISKEVTGYVSEFGTKTMRESLDENFGDIVDGWSKEINTKLSDIVLEMKNKLKSNKDQLARFDATPKDVYLGVLTKLERTVPKNLKIYKKLI